MAKVDATTVSDHLNRRSGLDTEIEVSKTDFLDAVDGEVTVYAVSQLADLVELVQNIDASTDVQADTTACDVI